MRRFLPRSLLGQMLLLMGAALLVAQLVNLSVILSEQQKLSLAQNEGPAIQRFAQAAALVARAPPGMRPRVIALHPRGPGARLGLGEASLVSASRLERSPELERRLAGALRDLGVPAARIEVAARSEFGPMPPRPGRPPLHVAHGYRKAVYLAVRFPDGQWLNGRLLAPHLDRFLLHQLFLGTFLLFAVVFGAVYWIARRLARPLRDLTLAAERFEGRAPAAPVEPRGPSDVRGAIEAFNAMNRRTLALLDEKDRMLGAIGHDLRTPLASLRIRAENMGPEEERGRLVATLEEMAATLEDILVLARTGRAREAVRPVDVAALADAAVEEQRAMGRPAAFRASPRTVLPVQANLLRRAIRNLIDNAVAYGGGAQAAVEADGGEVRIRIEDEGPGIPPDRLAEVLEPFARLEDSRSRESGGAGLGLAIADAVARAHGGRVELANRPGGGLAASLVLPKG
ncbi:MAG: ATP-binding protein [Allosphingosinicella sp.]